MGGSLEIAGDVVAASVALAGLVLVFLGMISTSFDGYDKSGQNAVRQRYQNRANLAFIGFVLALLSATSALVGKWIHSECLATTGAGLLLIAMAWVVMDAILAVRAIK